MGYFHTIYLVFYGKGIHTAGENWKIINSDSSNGSGNDMFNA